MMLPTGSRRKQNRNNGFTLIELMLVAVLLLTIIALSTPLFRQTFSDLAIKDASFSIAKLMNYAQDRSILDRKNFKIVFNLKGLAYQMFEKDVSAKEGEKWGLSPKGTVPIFPPMYKKVTGRYGRVYKLPKGTLFSGTRSEMIFYPDGRCDEIRLELFVKDKGYSITSKGFGNLIEIKEAERGK